MYIMCLNISNEISQTEEADNEKMENFPQITITYVD